MEMLSKKIWVAVMIHYWLFTLIRFGKFGEITVLMEKNAILTQTQVISTQWTLKRPKKLF